MTAQSETFNVPIDIIQEYLAGEANRLQKPLDDALQRALDGAIADQVMKSVIIKIVPDGATNPGDSSTVSWTTAIAREYLHPPGDSARIQPQINNPMTVMGRSAVNNNTVTSLIIEVSP